MTAPDDAEMRALREAVAVTPLEHVVALRITGEGAFALLDRLSTAPLFLREGEIRQSLLLDERGQIFADVLIASDEDGYFLLCEGPGEAELLAHIERQRDPAWSQPLQVTSLQASHELWGLNGPYAWELASALLGPAVLGMTYLSLLHGPVPGGDDEVICFRAGKTGEYGYDFLVPRPAAAAWRAQLERTGQPLGTRRVGLATLDQAALENWQFNIRTLAGAARELSLTPIELQLQWRLRYDRAFVGVEAVRARRAQGPTLRATCFVASGPVAAGDEVWLAQGRVGQVLATGWSQLRGEPVGIAMLELPFAYPGVEGLSVKRPGGPITLATRTPPLLNNRSLYVDPHRHNYATREADTFPPLVLE
jgi:glycine cleavage system aminomethyltransferase T